MLVILVVILVGGVGFLFWYRFRPDTSPIRAEELTPGTAQHLVDGMLHPYACVEPTPQLVARCRAAGGTVQYNVTSIGLGVQNTLGCYPEGDTTDEGKSCTLGIQCQGECIWMAGDLLNGNESKTCSRHKKPYFIYPETRLPKDAQGLCADLERS